MLNPFLKAVSVGGPHDIPMDMNAITIWKVSYKDVLIFNLS